MACFPIEEIQELVLCSCCKRAFDSGMRAPKILTCQHYFCLSCTRDVMEIEGEACCMHCHRRTELPGGNVAALPTNTGMLALAQWTVPESSCSDHDLPSLWCTQCCAFVCRACDQSHVQTIHQPRDARALLRRETHLLTADLQKYAYRQREFLLHVLDVTTALKVRLETELSAPVNPQAAYLDVSGQSLYTIAAEWNRLRARHSDMLLQCHLEDFIDSATSPLDFEQLRQAVNEFNDTLLPKCANNRCDPVLFLANYCTAQLYMRHCIQRRSQMGWAGNLPEPQASRDNVWDASEATYPSADTSLPLARLHITYPLFFFNLVVNGEPFGRVVIQVRDDVAPRMAYNFSVLATVRAGVCYRGCTVFQCWENESIITGDTEYNNGCGGRSVFDDNYFMPDDTRMTAVRGAVGMRRLQKHQDQLGLVGSQFRIILRDMRNFTGIFAFVVEGLEVVDCLSRRGDSAGKPRCNIQIADCGKLN